MCTHPCIAGSIDSVLIKEVSGILYEDRSPLLQVCLTTVLILFGQLAVFVFSELAFVHLQLYIAIELLFIGLLFTKQLLHCSKGWRSSYNTQC